MRASGRSSSSAAICASAVTMPWPSSTLPVNTVALPSGVDAEPGIEHPIVIEAAGQLLAARWPRATRGAKLNGDHDAAERRR